MTRSNPLKFKGNIGVTWNHRPWSAGWVARYFDAYIVSTTPSVIQAQGSTRVPSQIYHDLFVGYRFPTAREKVSGLPRLLVGTEFQIGVKNVFNTEPPLDVSSSNIGAGTFSPFGDPRGAIYYLSVKRTF